MVTTVYINQRDSSLHKRGKRLVVKKKDEIIAEIPLINVDQIVVFGNAYISGSLVSLLLRANIPLTYLSYYGRYQGRLVPGFSKNSILREKQHYAVSRQDFRLQLSKSIVKGKLKNMRTILMRRKRKAFREELEEASQEINKIITRIEEVNSIKKLRGLEGLGSRYYFNNFDKVLEGEFEFKGRNRRPPKDPVNSLLSFGYALLLKDIITALYIAGFDPYIGFYHTNQHGRPSLALDIMEEFRPVIIDSLVKSLINKKIISRDDFQAEENGVKIKQEAIEKIINKYENKLDRTYIHPHIGKKTTWRKSFMWQARLLAKAIREKKEYYPLVVK